MNWILVFSGFMRKNYVAAGNIRRPAQVRSEPDKSSVQIEGRKEQVNASKARMRVRVKAGRQVKAGCQVKAGRQVKARITEGGVRIANLKWLNIGTAVVVGFMIWFIWQAATARSPEEQSILARFFVSKLCFGQGSAAENFFNGSGRDWTRTTYPSVFLPVSVFAVVVFSLLPTLPRFLLWLLTSLGLAIAGIICFEALHLIIPLGGPLMLIACGYLSGTLICLESEKISRSRQLAMDMQIQSEAERKRIAKDLHDEALPSLSRVMRLADELQEDGGESPIPQEIRSRLESTVVEMRRIINDLHPAVLENLGLAAALQHLLDKLARETGIHATFRDESRGLKLTPFYSLCLYRIAQEALNNVEKHASASQVVLSLSRTQNCLSLSLSDNGCGRGEVRLKPESHGVQNIMHRAGVIGGRMQWKKPDSFSTGTMLVLMLPLDDKAVQPGAKKEKS
jgi:signal transduction histidine kinase